VSWDLFNTDSLPGGVNDILGEAEVTYEGTLTTEIVTTITGYVQLWCIDLPATRISTEIALGTVGTYEIDAWYTDVSTTLSVIFSDGSGQIEIQKATTWQIAGEDLDWTPTDTRAVFRLINRGGGYELWVHDGSTEGFEWIASYPSLPEATVWPAGVHILTAAILDYTRLYAVRVSSSVEVPRELPVAIITGSTAEVPTNTTVSFSGLDSYDPERQTLSYNWELDGPVPFRAERGMVYATGTIQKLDFTSRLNGDAGNDYRVRLVNASPFSISLSYPTISIYVPEPTYTYDYTSVDIDITYDGAAYNDTATYTVVINGIEFSAVGEGSEAAALAELETLIDLYFLGSITASVGGSLLTVQGAPFTCTLSALGGSGERGIGFDDVTINSMLSYTGYTWGDIADAVNGLNEFYDPTVTELLSAEVNEPIYETRTAEDLGDTTIDLSGGSDCNLAAVSFTPPIAGIYEVSLTVTASDGSASKSAKVTLVVSPRTMLTDYIPDGSRFWDLIPEAFYKLLDNSNVLDTYWSGLIQVFGSILHDVWTEDQNCDLQRIQDRISKRWLPYPTRIGLNDVFSAVGYSATRSSTVAAGSSYRSATILSGGHLDTGGSWEITSGINAVYVQERDSVHQVLRQMGDTVMLDPPLEYEEEISSGIAGIVDSAGFFSPYTGTTGADNSGNFYLEIANERYQITDISGDDTIDQAEKVTLASAPPKGTHYMWTVYEMKLDTVQVKELSSVRVGITAANGDVVETTDGDEYDVLGSVNSYLLFDPVVTSMETSGTIRRLKFKKELPTYRNSVSVPVIKQAIAWSEVKVANGRKGKLYANGVFEDSALPSTFVTNERYELEISGTRYVLSSTSPVTLQNPFPPTTGITWELYRILAYVEERDYTFDSDTNRLVFDVAHDFPPFLWAETTWFDNRDRVFASFGDVAGVDLEHIADIEVDYSDAVRGLFYGLLRDSFVESIEGAIALLTGVPVALYAGTITSIENEFTPNTSRMVIAGTNTVNVYTYPSDVLLAINPDTGERYAVGDAVVRFAQLTEGVEILDWVNAPGRFAILYDKGLLHPLQERHYFEVHIDANHFPVIDWTLQASLLCRLHPSHKWHRLIADINFVEDFPLGRYERFDLATNMFIIEDLHTDTSSQGQYHVGFDSYDGAGQIQVFANMDDGTTDSDGFLGMMFQHDTREHSMVIMDNTYTYVGSADDSLATIVTQLKAEVDAASLPGVSTALYDTTGDGAQDTLIVTWNKLGGSAAEVTSTFNQDTLDRWRDDYIYGYEEGDAFFGPHAVADRAAHSGYEAFAEPWLGWYIIEGAIPTLDMGLILDSEDEDGLPDFERGLPFWLDEIFRTKYKDVSGNWYPDPNGDMLKGMFVCYPYCGFGAHDTPRPPQRPQRDQLVIDEVQYVSGTAIDPPYEGTSPYYMFQKMSGSPTSIKLDGSSETADPDADMLRKLTQSQSYTYTGDGGTVRQYYLRPGYQNHPIPVIDDSNLSTVQIGGQFSLVGRYFSPDEIEVWFGDLEATDANTEPEPVLFDYVVVGSATSTTVTFSSGASGDDDAYVTWEIEVTSGAGSGQKRYISAYDGSTKTATITVAWGTQPSSSDSCALRYLWWPDTIEGTVPSGTPEETVDVVVISRGKTRVLEDAYKFTSDELYAPFLIMGAEGPAGRIWS